jgi:hypothetical protein
MGANVLAMITIVAIILGPILALYIQRKLDTERASQERKVQIFRTLMSHRATRLTPAFVEALNAIEVEFYAEKNGTTKRVIEAWHEYCDSLYNADYKDPGKLQGAVEKSMDLLNEMLAEMGILLGYHFEKGIFRRMVYNPQGWVDTDQDQLALRKAAVEVFSGQKPLHMKIEGPIEINEGTAEHQPITQSRGTAG